MKKSVLIVATSVVLSVLCSGAICRYSSLRAAESGRFFSFSNDSTSSAAVTSRYAVTPDFVYAAESSVDAVVFIQVAKRSEVPQNMSFLQHFFGYDIQPQRSMSSGSGVIITPDGYIVTNNHVVEGASEIKVTLNDQKSFSAKVIGTDPITDIALIKIDSKELPVVPMGDSDSLRLGEWVLAIGCPYSMNNTVTAGIVSAKGRTLGAAANGFKIESYIQTDAAVNPGNSGGALVNLKGELVGINTAIASPTGAFAGYSFAVPSSLVKKMVSDLLQYGTIQRAQLGVSTVTMSSDVAEALKIADDTQGAAVAEVIEGSAAQKGGIKVNDVIVAVDGHKVTSSNELQERINIHRPGDGVTISVVRGGKSVECNVVLQLMDLNAMMDSQARKERAREEEMMRQYQRQQRQYYQVDPWGLF